MSPHLPELFTMFFDKESYCVEYVEQTAEVVQKLQFLIQGQDPRQISVFIRRRAKRAENFYNFFSSLQSIDQTFFF